MTLAAPLLPPPIYGLAEALWVAGWASRWAVVGLAATMPASSATTWALGLRPRPATAAAAASAASAAAGGGEGGGCGSGDSR